MPFALLALGVSFAADPRPPSPAEAAEKPPCEAGDLDACFRLAAAYQFGHGDTPIDLDAARTLLEKGCKADHGPSCNDLGAMYGEGVSVTKNSEEAAKLYDKACSLDHGMACANLARFKIDGVGVEQDAAASEKLYLKACTLGDAGGCNDVALGYAQLRPGFPSKPKAAIPLLTRGCDELEDGMACANLGYLYGRGIGTAEDPVKGFSYMQKGCRLGNAQACEFVR